MLQCPDSAAAAAAQWFSPFQVGSLAVTGQQRGPSAGLGVTSSCRQRSKLSHQTINCSSSVTVDTWIAQPPFDLRTSSLASSS